MKRVAVIGSTGSIGTNTLEVIGINRDRFEPYALAVGSNVAALEAQIRRFRPKCVCVWDTKKAAAVEKKYSRRKLTVYAGADGLLALIKDQRIDMFVFALSGSNGIRPLLEALKSGRRVAVANKEPLVIARDLVRSLVKRHNAELLPIDSEHSALFQCLDGVKPASVEKLIITASGGPFYGLPKARFASITPRQALRHPKWSMGRKITIDSATMMNKALELIEATTLFGVPETAIDILIHPEALIHSLVQFRDGSLLAQVAAADMRIPIQYALTYPERLAAPYPRIDFARIGQCRFVKPDPKKFPTLAYGYWAAREGGTLPAVLNAADEVCVDSFLNGTISFVRIMNIIEKVMRRHTVRRKPSYDIMGADRWAREEAERLCLRR